MIRYRLALLVLAAWILTASVRAPAGEHPENGLYLENWPNGKKKIACWYKKGQLSGSCKEYDENGKLIKECNYKDGKMDGLCSEYFPSGKAKLAAEYLEGVPNGRLTEFDEKGRLVRDQVFVNGLLRYPRSLAEIGAALKNIYAAAPKAEGALFDESPSYKGDFKAGRLAASRLDEALAQLKAYRYLAGVPYEDIGLNDRYVSEAQHAAVLLAALGRLDHTPKRPADVPEEFFKAAYAGTSHGNLAQGRTRLPDALDCWMCDSDPTNIDRLGHRRWCINPAMKETGFGLCGIFQVIWAHDASRKNAPDFDYIAFPAAGFHPARYFGADWAWSVSLNPKKYEAPKKGEAKAKIWELDALYRDKGEPLELNYENVNNDGFGVPFCVIFRPKGVKLSAGSRYRVAVEGVKEKRAKAPGIISYVVEFCDLPK